MSKKNEEALKVLNKMFSKSNVEHNHKQDLSTMFNLYGLRNILLCLCEIAAEQEEYYSACKDELKAIVKKQDGD